MDMVEAEEEPILVAVEIGQLVRYVINMDIQDINVSFAACMALPVEEIDNGWYLDSGATHHVTNDLNNLQIR